MEYYVTKNVLTRGIQILECEDVGDGYVRQNTSYWTPCFKVGKDAHITFADAVTKANQTKERKLKALKKQLERIEKLTFDTTS